MSRRRPGTKGRRDIDHGVGKRINPNSSCPIDWQSAALMLRQAQNSLKLGDEALAFQAGVSVGDLKRLTKVSTQLLPFALEPALTQLVDYFETRLPNRDHATR